MKAKEIQELIDFISKSGLDEVNIETEEFKIKVKKNSEVKTKISRPAKGSFPSTSSELSEAEISNKNAQEEIVKQKAAAAVSASEEAKYKTVTSPMIGTFYRSSNPEAPAFINVGDKITAGQTVCIVEAMKLFNEIESEISGTVIKILAENASPVEYDQPLFLVDPS